MVQTATWPLISREDEMGDERKRRLEPEPTVCVRECEGESDGQHFFAYEEVREVVDGEIAAEDKSVVSLANGQTAGSRRLQSHVGNLVSSWELVVASPKRVC